VVVAAAVAGAVTETLQRLRHDRISRLLRPNVVGAGPNLPFTGVGTRLGVRRLAHQSNTSTADPV
jgi:hypothetical protein